MALIPQGHLTQRGDPARRFRLMELVRVRLRERRYATRTVEAYVFWIRRFILHHGRRHPRELGADAVRVFLSHLATVDRVAASTQNQALAALLSNVSPSLDNATLRRTLHGAMRLIFIVAFVVLVAHEAAAQLSGTDVASASRRPAFAAPAWAFPTQLPPPADPFPTADSVHLRRIPGIHRRFTQKAALDRFAPADWLPHTHPAAPPPVANGRRPAAIACAFCHLYNGAGRPENATLAGLPATYIVRQVRAFRDSTRLTANPVARTTSMHGIARAFTDDEVREAAAYFARLHLTRRNRVVETMQVPRHRVAGLLYVRDGDGTEPIAGRLIEMPENSKRHELHDPTVRYVTYVPTGSLALGRRLAHAGPSGVATACVTCHGPSLLGVADIPPIAGRSPQYLLRQLVNFRTGARAASGSAPMLAVVQAMSLREMVAAAAYVGSLAPSPR